MKAEINNENKAKFFAQYWGQDILCSDMYGDGGTIYSATMKDSSIKNEWLELKPLSDIRDEDAIEVCNIVHNKAYVFTNVEIHHGKLFVRRLLGFKFGNLTDNNYKPDITSRVVDFLRSRGYLVPWMGLSCEELIEAGWAKYKE